MMCERREKDIALARAGWELIPIWPQDATDLEIEDAMKWASFVNSHLPQGSVE